MNNVRPVIDLSLCEAKGQSKDDVERSVAARVLGRDAKGEPYERETGKASIRHALQISKFV